MQSTFELLIMELKPVYDMPAAWTEEMFRQILQRVGFKEIENIEPD